MSVWGASCCSPRLAKKIYRRDVHHPEARFGWGKTNFGESGWWRIKLCSPVRGWQLPSPNKTESVSTRGGRARTTKTVLNTLSISGSSSLVKICLPFQSGGMVLHSISFHSIFGLHRGQCTPIESVFSTRWPKDTMLRKPLRPCTSPFINMVEVNEAVLGRVVGV